MDVTEHQIDIWLRHRYGADTGIRARILREFNAPPEMCSPDHGWSKHLTTQEIRAAQVWSIDPRKAWFPTSRT